MNRKLNITELADKMTVKSLDPAQLESNLRWNSFVSHRHKLVYVATPKVACTTLKWWFAALEGLTGTIHADTRSQETDPDLVIHDLFPLVAPAVNGLEPEALAEILASKAYFKFSLVRNPYTRIFSAWQSKLLLHEPLQVGPYLKFDFTHLPVNRPEDIAKLFEAFLEHLTTHEAPMFWDVHWTPQVKLLRSDMVAYDRIAKIEDTRTLQTALRERLGNEVPNPFAARHANESIVPYVLNLITTRSAELIQQLYSADFAAFGYDTSPPDTKSEMSELDFGLAIRAIQFARARHQRLGEIRGALRRQIDGLQMSVTEEQEKNAVLRQSLVDLEQKQSLIARENAEAEGETRLLKNIKSEMDRVVTNLREALEKKSIALQRLSTEHDAEIRWHKRVLEEERESQLQVQRKLEENQDSLRLAYEKDLAQQTEIAALAKAVADSRDSMQSLQSILQKKFDQFTQLVLELGHHEQELAAARQREAFLQERIQLLESNNKDSAHQLREKLDRIVELESELGRHGQELSAAQKQVATLQEQTRLLESKNEDSERQLNLLASVAANYRDEAGRVFSHLETVLNSRSWRFTKPLRVLFRMVRYRSLPQADRYVLLIQLRALGRRLPIPYSVRTRLRSWALRALQCENTGAIHSQVSGGFNPLPTEIPAKAIVALGQAEAMGRMRPECCGLKPGKVSVVLPVYNQANLLALSIDSVLQQTYGNFELIVVNDGSTDGVEKILEKYSSHPKVRIFNQPNQKLPKALSNGFDQADGEYWTWTSADNLMEPRQLEALVARLEARPEVGMLYADYYAIDDRGDLLQDPEWRKHNRPNIDSGLVRLPRTTKALNTVQDNFIGACFMYRGWIGRVLGEYDPTQGVEDYDYWMRINNLFSIEHLGSDEALYRYRVHDNSLNARAREEKILEKVQALMKHEVKRAAYYGRPLKLIVDDRTAAACAALGFPGEHMLNIKSAGIGCTATLDSCAFVLSAATAVGLEQELERHAAVPLVLFFDSVGAEPYEHIRLLKRPTTLAVVNDSRTADRVRLIAPIPVIDGKAGATLQAIQGFAKNAQFLRRTRPHESPNSKIFKAFKSRSKKKSILLQVDDFTQGGLENVVIDLGVTMVQEDFDVQLLVLGEGGPAVEKARSNGLNIVVCDGKMTAARYKEHLLRNGIAVVNAHYSVFGAGIAADIGIPFVETIHNSYVWFDASMKEAYRNADPSIKQYIAVSIAAAKYSDISLGLNVEKLRVIPNGIDPRAIDRKRNDADRAQIRHKWNIGQNAPVYLNVASILATKAQLPLVTAFACVLRDMPESRLILLGSVMEPNYYEAVKKRVHDLGIGSNVIFAGYNRDVARYYHAADVFVLPSFWEGWSLSLAEAMINGLQCVATDVGSAYEFSGTGRLHSVTPPFGDITALNHLNIGKYVYGEDKDFECRIAQAMVDAARQPRGKIDESLVQRLDRSNAYRSYASLFSNL